MAMLNNQMENDEFHGYVKEPKAIIIVPGNGTMGLIIIPWVIWL